MSRPNLGPSDKARLTAIEAQLHNLARTGDPSSMAMRDLSDAALVPVANGQVPTYDFASGMWKPATPATLHPAGSYFRTTPQTIANAVDTAVIGTTATVQGGVTWDGSGGLVVPRTGWYVLTAAIKWVTNSTGQRSLHIYGVQVLADVHVMAGAMSGPGMNASVIANLNGGSSWGMSVLQQSGAALDIEAAASYSPYFSVHWLGY